jgi:hypothetical protein
MRRLLAAAALAGVLLASSAASAAAAPPANRACFGNDFSGYAQNFSPLGQLITSFAVGGTAIIAGGLGAEVQNHLAGNVPDAAFPNSCND